MEAGAVGEILAGLWRFEGVHPEWTEDESGEDGWEASVASWALAAPAGLVLIDPLVEDWSALDRLVADQRGCAGIVRTCHWHQRSIARAAERYSAGVWAKPRDDGKAPPPDHALGDRARAFDVVEAVDVERGDELALWLTGQRALLFGDAMLRRPTGELRMCPESWTQPPGGRPRLRELLGALTGLPVEHVLVSHGPLVLSDGREALTTALAE